MAKGLSTLGVEPTDERFNKRLIGRHRLKIGAPPQIQRLTQAPFEIPVARFYRAVLVGDAGVVSRRLQAIVLTEILIKLGQGLPPPSPIAIGRTQAIGAVLFRSSPASL